MRTVPGLWHDVRMLLGNLYEMNRQPMSVIKTNNRMRFGL